MSISEKRCAKHVVSKGQAKTKHWEKLKVAANEVREWPEWKRVGFQTSSATPKKAKAKK